MLQCSPLLPIFLALSRSLHSYPSAAQAAFTPFIQPNLGLLRTRPPLTPSSTPPLQPLVTPAPHHISNPSLQHPITLRRFDSSTHHSSTPSFQCPITPAPHHSGTPSLLRPIISASSGEAVGQDPPPTVPRPCLNIDIPITAQPPSLTLL